MARTRNLILAALVAAATLGSSLPAVAQIYMPGAEPVIPPKDSTLTIRVQRLAPGVFAAKVNYVWTGWVELPDGILVVDAGLSDSSGMALADTIRARSPKLPFRYLVLTHAHEDHFLGAKAFVDAGATLVAQTGVAAYIDSAVGAPASKGVRVERRKRFGNAARPVDVVWLGRDAHSKGDMVVHLPKQRILFTGDLVSNKSVPWLLDPGFSLKGWMASLDSLQTKAFPADQLVPGHGVIGKPSSAILFTRNYLRDADEKASRVAGWGTSTAEARKWGYLGAYEGMEFYDEVHFMNIKRLYAEAKGIKTPGRARTRALRK